MRYLISGINQIEIFHSFLSYRCSNTHVIYTHCEKKFSLKHLDRTIPSQLQHVFTEAPTSRVSPAIFLFLFQYNYKYICMYMFQHIYLYIIHPHIWTISVTVLVYQSSLTYLGSYGATF